MSPFKSVAGCNLPTPQAVYYPQVPSNLIKLSNALCSSSSGGICVVDENRSNGTDIWHSHNMQTPTQPSVFRGVYDGGSPRSWCSFMFQRLHHTSSDIWTLPRIVRNTFRSKESSARWSSSSISQVEGNRYVQSLVQRQFREPTRFDRIILRSPNKPQFPTMMRVQISLLVSLSAAIGDRKYTNSCNTFQFVAVY